MARILPIDPVNPDQRVLARVVKVLRKGGVVAFPTDTVYGIGGDAFLEESIEKIYRIKRRGREKPLVLFVRKKGELREYVRGLPEIGERLVDSYFPGPLTIISKASAKAPSQLVLEGSVGVRIPDHPLVQSLLERYGRPLATTSANLTEGKSSLSAPEVASSLQGVDLIIDGGKSGSSTPSTVVDVSTYPPILLRKGKIPVLSLEKVMRCKIKLEGGLSFNILFVCTGNCCRSPLAEALLEKLMPESLSRRVRVESAGTAAFDGYPPPEFAIEVGRELGIDLSSHRSQEVNAKLINDADLILVMEPFHRDRLLEWAPEALDKIDFLRTVGREAVREEETTLEDPAGGSRESYERCAKEIEDSLSQVIQWLRERLD